MFDIKLFLKALKSLSESQYTQYRIGNPVSVKSPQFDSNCKEFADVIDAASKRGTHFQTETLKSIARHVRNKNLHLAQEVIRKLDDKTKKLIPIHIVTFISKYS